MRPLRAKAVRWMAWATVAQAGRDVLNLAGRLVLARLLWPEAFGLFALAAAVAAGMRICCQLQLDAAIVQRPRLDPGLRATAHWSLVALSAVGALLLLGLAGPLGGLLGHRPMVPLLRILSLYVLLGGFAVVPRAWLARELSFRRLAAAGLLAEVVGTAVAIAAAAGGAGVYSLAADAVVTALVEVVLLRSMVPWRPARHWRVDEFLELYRFGWPLLGRRGIDYLTTQGDRLLVGYAIGTEALGFYAIALRLVKGAADSVAGIFESVAFPAFVHTQDDAPRTRRGFLDALRLQAALTFPVVVGLGLVAHEIVPLALGARWAGAIPLVPIIAGRAALVSLLAVPRAVLLARGRQWVVVSISGCALAAYALGWTSGIPWGVVGVAAGGTAAGVLLVPVALWMMRSDLPVTMGALARALLPAVIGTVAMTAGVLATRWFVPGFGVQGRAVRAVVLAAVGAVCYVLPLLPWLARERGRFRDLGLL